MRVEIITPEKTLFEGEASFVYLPGSDGSLGVLNNHAPLISSLKKGAIRVKEGSVEHTFQVKGGTVEVLSNKVIILAE
ncbi:MAG: ATP synthase F1 subunit epsilon [Crocinitomicaceae bacterium]|nr:ATP synthase F1 subunit epsilon [Crocinitomicaceae bacterium]